MNQRYESGKYFVHGCQFGLVVQGQFGKNYIPLDHTFERPLTLHCGYTHRQLRDIPCAPKRSLTFEFIGAARHLLKIAQGGGAESGQGFTVLGQGDQSGVGGG